MIRALIFDFDGLILDTEGAIFQSWQEFFNALGCQLSFETWSATIGTVDVDYDPLDDLEGQLGRKLDRSRIAAERLQREMELILAEPALPGVQDYLESARKLKLRVGLASSSNCAWVTSHLERLGLIDFFDCIMASDDVWRTKPDPTLYLKALECLEVQPEEAVAFEDSPIGIRAAKLAGLYCVTVPNPLTRRLSVDHADMRLDSLAELPLEVLLQEIEEAMH